MTLIKGGLINDSQEGVATLVDNPSTSVSFSSTDGNVFTVHHGLSKPFFNWSMWRTDVVPTEIMMPLNVEPSGDNHAIITLDVPVDGTIIFS